MAAVAFRTLQPNPLATPQGTFRVTAEALRRDDLEQAWETVDPENRRQCLALAFRIGRAPGEDPLHALAREGLRRYPDLRRLRLLRVEPLPRDPDRVRARLGFGPWEASVELVRRDGSWRWDGVAEAIARGPRRSN